ncbi:MAG: class I SAM-dependent methyltransferase [Candidatus Moranbacteria bacterium]|nr:class I SAM-dependent methyltransferase [Candidatus Moranbacteria bacterium]
MASIKDDRGFNQGFRPSKALDIRTERRCDYMISKMNCSENTSILEIGCGTGEISFLLAKKNAAEVTGTDLCTPFINEAQNRYNLENLKYKQLDFNNPESIDRVLGKDKFDYIVGNGILHHLYYQIDDALRNIHSLLKDNGKLIFLEPNILNPYCFLIFRFSLFRKMAKLEPGEMAFMKKFIEKKLTRAGFKDIEVEYRDFLLPGTPNLFIKPLISLGNIIEKIPAIKKISQSIFITAIKK